MSRAYVVVHANGGSWVASPPENLVTVGLWTTSARAASWAFGKWGPASNGFTSRWAVRPIEIQVAL